MKESLRRRGLFGLSLLAAALLLVPPACASAETAASRELLKTNARQRELEERLFHTLTNLAPGTTAAEARAHLGASVAKFVAPSLALVDVGSRRARRTARKTTFAAKRSALSAAASSSSAATVLLDTAILRGGNGRAGRRAAAAAASRRYPWKSPEAKDGEGPENGLAEPSKECRRLLSTWMVNCVFGP